MTAFATRLTKHLFITITLLLLAQLAIPTQAQTQITRGGTTIDTPGRYVLANDLSCSDNGITIEASQVRLNLNGHTIIGNAGRGAGILIAENNVEIDGPGTISGFENGICVMDFYGHDLMVQNVSVYATIAAAFAIEECLDCTFPTIRPLPLRLDSRLTSASGTACLSLIRLPIFE